MDFRNEIKRAKENERQKERDWEEMKRRHELEAQEQKEYTAELVNSGKIVKLNPKEYARWLANYIENGGKITHVYDYDINRQTWYKANSFIFVKPLHGALSFNLLFPKELGRAFEIPDGLGHNNIYYYEDGMAKCFGDSVPLFDNIDRLISHG